MGTNYYVTTPPCADACEHCDVAQRVHLGKSSGGWRCLFRADPEWDPFDAFAQWLKLATSGPIVDEYGNAHTVGDVLRLIHDKQELQSRREPQPNGSYRASPADLRGIYTADGHEFDTSEFS